MDNRASENRKIGIYFVLYILGFAMMLLIQLALSKHNADNELMLLSGPIAFLSAKLGETRFRKKAGLLFACFLVSFATIPIYQLAPGTLKNPFCGPISFLVILSVMEGVKKAEPCMLEFKRRQASRDKQHPWPSSTNDNEVLE